MEKMDQYAHNAYRVTKKFPKEEAYGITSQLRRSSLSVPLNYIEGYSRARDKVYVNFLEISYGSLRESKYLLKFSLGEGYISQGEFDILDEEAEEIGAMLWGILKNKRT